MIANYLFFGTTNPTGFRGIFCVSVNVSTFMLNSVIESVRASNCPCINSLQSFWSRRISSIYAFWFCSSKRRFSICNEFSYKLTIRSRISTNARIIFTLIIVAIGLRNTAESIATPCSVKTNISEAPMLYCEGITFCDTPLSNK